MMQSSVPLRSAAKDLGLLVLRLLAVDDVGVESALLVEGANFAVAWLIEHATAISWCCVPLCRSSSSFSRLLSTMC